MTAQSPMETLHRNSQGASESNYGPFKANANDTGLLMKLMAGENEMLIKTQEIQRTLIDTQTGKESSGISQLEQYQKVSESKMKLIALPFKSIAMPDRGVSPNDTSIS